MLHVARQFQVMGRFRHPVRVRAMMRLVTMMMLLMMPVWRSLRRSGRHKKDGKQQRGENSTHDTSPQGTTIIA